ncbi:tail fiber assembly protein [Neisseriaceae bacterium TC5R-5]|nr:tail fiber assembly protein [Neisseriaceae bacterium TC5R-5]
MTIQKTVYAYHPQTGEYLGETVADRSPLEQAEVWLIPAHATEFAPPSAGEQEVAVFEDGAWKRQADWRKVPLWSTQSAQSVQAQIGDTPNSLQATMLEPPQFACWQGEGWGVDEAAQQGAHSQQAEQALQQALANAYAKRRPLEDAAELGIANAQEQQQLSLWKQYCVALARLPQLAQWPLLADSDWPVAP